MKAWKYRERIRRSVVGDCYVVQLFCRFCRFRCFIISFVPLLKSVRNLSFCDVADRIFKANTRGSQVDSINDDDDDDEDDDDEISKNDDDNDEYPGRVSGAGRSSENSQRRE